MANQTNDPLTSASAGLGDKSRAGAKRKGGGAQLNRSETVTVRLDPKLRYLAELASRKQRRTLSSFIEWAIEDSLGRVYLGEGGYNNDPNPTIADESTNLWDVDDPDRFAKLALGYPDLLTHEEQKRWKLIRENGSLWKGHKVDYQALCLDRLRKHWDNFCAVARGESSKDTLPACPALDNVEPVNNPDLKDGVSLEFR